MMIFSITWKKIPNKVLDARKHLSSKIGAFIFGEFKRRKTMEYQGRWYRKVTLRGNDYVYANFGTRNFRVCFPDKLLIAVESKTLADFNLPIITIIELLKRLIITNIEIDLHQLMRKLENL